MAGNMWTVDLCPFTCMGTLRHALPKQIPCRPGQAPKTCPNKYAMHSNTPNALCPEKNGLNPQMPKVQHDGSWCHLMLEIRLGIRQDEWALTNTIHPSSFPTGRTGVKFYTFLARRTPTSSPKNQSPLKYRLTMPFRPTQSRIHTQ